jgi:GTP-binding protein
MKKKPLCEFLLGATNTSHFPDTKFDEFAFIGASNVGKSSLINAIVSEKIAITSKTPGRTRQLNFFLVENSFILVDMPGYGFARAHASKIDDWQKISFEYFAKRRQLKCVFFLVDPVRGLKKSDIEMANILNALAVNFYITLTKIDKIKTQELEVFVGKIKEQTKLWSALHPKILVSSSKENKGTKEVREVLFGKFI